MLNETTYYHGIVKKYVTLFGTIFNDVFINRTKSTGETKESVKVPIAYGPREKFLVRPETDPELLKPVAMVLPRMGFEINSMNYAPERKTQTMRKFITEDSSNPDKRTSLYNPVPYDIGFSLGIYAKYFDDLLQVVEQILPYFTPDYTPTIQLIESPEVVMDIPVVFQGIGNEDVYEGSFEERRILIWTLDFIMKGWLFGPTYKEKAIKLANVNFYDASRFDDIEEAFTNTDPSARITTYPGQDANGDATTNAEIAVNTSIITSNSDWDYIVTIDDPLTEE